MVLQKDNVDVLYSIVLQIVNIVETLQFVNYVESN